MDILLRYYGQKKMHLFIGVLIVNLIIIWLSKSTLINETVFYNTYSEQLTYERSLKLFENLKKYSWIAYAFMPLALLIKFSLISLVLYIGVFLLDFHNKVKLSSVFGIVVASESVFVIAGLVKFILFYFFAGNYTLTDLNFFYPFSLINLFSPGEVNKIWIFPLQTVNVFQLLYVIFLAY